MTVTFLLAAKADKIMDDFTWALATGMSYKKLSLISPFSIFTGGVPLLHATLAPISFNGLATLSIGLFDNDSSPTRVALISKLDISPINNLIPVPEFPKSISVSGEINGISLFKISTSVPLIFIDEPIAFKAIAVDIGSSPLRKPLMDKSSLISEPMITIL